jgi:hypothetical protein
LQLSATYFLFPQNIIPRYTYRIMKVTFLLSLLFHSSTAFVPFLDGGKGIPKLYDGYFDEQICKQASTAVAKAIAAGNNLIEVNFPPVPNVDEVRFGTPLNQKFGTNVVAKDLKVNGGYKPGSDLSRQLIAYSNVYWAKKIAGAVKGGALGGKSVAVLTAENVIFSNIKSMGDLSRSGKVNSDKARKESRDNECIICVNPGGEETWDRIYSAHATPSSTMVVLNNAYSTSYDLGNKRGYEEAYYLKRISKGWVYRSYPGNWEAYLEKPDGSCELLQSYKTKPSLREVSELVRDTSFKRYAINNDRWTSGFGGRL